jgi:hypothetical protein
MADSQATYRIQGTRWTLHNTFGGNAVQGVCRGRCTPDVALSSIHYIGKLTLHHIMAYDHQPHHITPIYHSLTHPNQITSNQLPQQLNQHVYLACSVHICAKLIYFTCSVHMPSSHSHHPYVLCSYVVRRFRFRFFAQVLFRLFVFVNSLFRHVLSSSNSMLLVGLSVCFSRFVCF